MEKDRSRSGLLVFSGEKTERDLNLFYLTLKRREGEGRKERKKEKERSESEGIGSFHGEATLQGRTEEEFSCRPFFRLSQDALHENYVKREGQSARIDSHRRMFYGAYYFRRALSSRSRALSCSCFSLAPREEGESVVRF